MCLRISIRGRTNEIHPDPTHSFYLPIRILAPGPDLGAPRRERAQERARDIARRSGSFSTRRGIARP